MRCVGPPPARPGRGPVTPLLAQIAGSASGVDWSGTFGWILVPGIGVGALLGWAEQLRTSGGRRGWRWLALSPLLFSAIVFSRPLDLLSILEDHRQMM